ncbi:MAG: hypothetical protein WD827_02070 [Solirubrobacterales bacterium]
MVATIRGTADWRRRKAYEFEGDRCARKACLRTAQALRVLANFVEGLPDDDPDLARPALLGVGTIGDRLVLAPHGSFLLSRFGIGKRSWHAEQPTESQMRSLLRRLDGVEARKQAKLNARQPGDPL